MNTPAHSSSGRRVAAAAMVAAASLLLAACGSTTTGATSSPASSQPPTPVPSSFAPVTVTLITHDSFAVTKSLLTDFTARTGITVKVVSEGDAGEVVNKAALTAGNPEGDVLFGVDNTLLSRALEAGVFDPYVSPAAADVPAALKAATQDAVTPVDYGDVCINLDDAWFRAHHLAEPTTLADLTKPEYKDLLVVENAATSSPGLAFLLATVARYGTDGYLGYWTSLRANGVKVVNGWTEAYEDTFSAGGKGNRPIVVSYATSPPADIVYAPDPKPTKPSTSVMTDGCFRQVEYAGVLRGTSHPLEARAVVDWLLSPAVQKDVPLSMFVDPAVPGTPLPKVFTDFAAVPADPLSLDPAVIDKNRSAWVQAWDQVTLR
ncbi:MAG: thiamine ABC transporter substrate-binding protein [Frankiales bacterium]|nr:thiamine ABC transporter substrate-binding protein [Frankiales bacterium]